MILSMTLSETLEEAAPTMTSASASSSLSTCGARDVGGAVAGVGLDLHDVLAEHAAGRVDLLDGQVDARELGRAEEGEVTGLRQQGADGQGAVALGRRAPVESLGGAEPSVLVVAVVVAAAGGEHERSAATTAAQRASARWGGSWTLRIGR